MSGNLISRTTICIRVNARRVTSTSMHNKILGGLYGQALGDAFAMPAQVHPDDTERCFGWLDSWQSAPDDHIVHAGLPAGRITDDSEQAFSIAQAVIDAGAVTLEAAVTGIVSWYDRVDGDNSPYVGPSTRRGVNALKAGEDPRTTGLWGDTNGAPMRISPIGLLHPRRHRGRSSRHRHRLHAHSFHPAGCLGRGGRQRGHRASHGRRRHA